MDLIKLLEKRKTDFETIKERASERIESAQKLFRQIDIWLEELNVKEYLEFVKKEDNHTYGLTDYSYTLRGLGYSILFRHIKDPNEMRIMINNTNLFKQDGEWYYEERGKLVRLDRDSFEILLTRELSSKHTDHY